MSVKTFAKPELYTTLVVLVPFVYILMNLILTFPDQNIPFPNVFKESPNISNIMKLGKFSKQELGEAGKREVEKTSGGRVVPSSEIFVWV